MSGATATKRPRARPPLFGETMIQVAFRLTKQQRDWVRVNGGAAYIRELVNRAIADSQGASQTIEKIAREQMNTELRGKVFERLNELGFSKAEIEVIGLWWRLYISDEHYEWFMTASYDEIMEASAPAFEEE